jgi:transposase-like protein
METVSMSYEELDRVGVIERVIEKRLTQREVARMLGLTSRQVRRLRRAYEQDGARALASKHRGRPSNRRLPSDLRREALATVRSQYEGFGPTLAHEKLTELHDLRLSVETLRHWMIEDGLWVPRARREPRIQQPRRRRPCRGELIQIDGCDHEWFEERAERCTLLVFVDDATSALMELLFCESESAFSYFAAMHSYLEQHGKPVALYSDKAGVFRVNHYRLKPVAWNPAESRSVPAEAGRRHSLWHFHTKVRIRPATPVTLQILFDHLLRHRPRTRTEVAARPEMLPPIAPPELRKLLLQLPRRPPLHPLHDLRRRQVRRCAHEHVHMVP